MDAATRMILYKWINSGELFDRVEGVIATGKVKQVDFTSFFLNGYK